MLRSEAIEQLEKIYNNHIKALEKLRTEQGLYSKEEYQIRFNRLIRAKNIIKSELYKLIKV